MSILKIDWDCKQFHKYILKFTRVYSMLRTCGVRIDHGTVFRTKKGYHIYLDEHFLKSRLQICLAECFLGSDINKQLYSFVEGNDILFKVKDSVENEFLCPIETMQICEVIETINSRTFKIVKLEGFVNGKRMKK